jgi:DNA-binding XRE family transcriptional regulator
MLLTGNQLRAARALADVDQQNLADRAQVHVNTIRAMEGKGAEEITSAVNVLRRVQAAMESFGIVFTNGDAPGVKLSPVVPATNGKGSAKAAVSKPAVKKPRDDAGAIAAAAC